MSDGYRRQRQVYQDLSGGLLVTPFTSQTTLASYRGSNTIYVQKVNVSVTGALAGTTWSVQDSSGVVIAGPLSVAALPSTPWVSFDFGANGIALTVNTNLVFAPSAPGATGVVTWEAYQRLVPGTAVALTTNA